MARKRTMSLRRNLLGLLLLLVAATAAAVAPNLLNREPELVMPEKFDPTFRMADRASSDNACLLLQEAQGSLPAAPTEVSATLVAAADSFSWRVRPFVPAPVDFLGVSYDGPATLLSDYLLQCAPSVERMQAALEKPYCLGPEPPHFLGGSPMPEFHPLAAAAVGHALVLTRLPGKMQLGVETLLDCVRLARMLYPEQGQLVPARGIEEHALQALALVARKPQAAQHLEWMQARLAEIGPPYPERAAVVEALWHKIDCTLTFEPAREIPVARRVELYLFIRDAQYWASSWREHKGMILEMCALPPSRYRAHIARHPLFLNDELDDWTRLWWHERLLREAAQHEYYHHRAALSIAMERFRLARGSYPAKLEELAPDLLPAIPRDPMTFLSFVYHNDGARAWAYGLGLNETDENGAGDDMLLVSFP